VFKLNPLGKFTLLHNFGSGGAGGANPFASVVRDSAGNLYGSTVYGGSNGRGTVFKLTKNGTFSVLLNFSSSWVSPGDGPRGPLALDPQRRPQIC
jgi:uncharacterized repeat protein (TIGR03803 family)